MKFIRTRDYIEVDFETDKVLKAAGTTRAKWRRMGEWEQNKVLAEGWKRLTEAANKRNK
jgi:hypothetical protein